MKSILPIFCLALLIFSVANVSASNDVGQSVYTKSCAACHASGIMGAPKFGDKAAWAYLNSEGLDTLTHNAINGKGKMPPKGGNVQLTDTEVKAAVAYMMEMSK